MCVWDVCSSSSCRGEGVYVCVCVWLCMNAVVGFVQV